MMNTSKNIINKLTLLLLQECNEKIIISNLKKEFDSTQLESVEAIGKVQWIIRRP